MENGELVQKLPKSVNQWNGGDPMTMLGDFRWMNYAASVDVTKLTGYATLVIRSQGGMGTNDDGYALTVKPDGSWNLKRYSTVEMCIRDRSAGWADGDPGEHKSSAGPAGSADYRDAHRPGPENPFY